ncbi:DNA damage-regulated autophagy modulator protein 1-like [Rhinoderma darwinii]|uniref:DNA damage-regulated autophagy modulator protein 1-like n=1 Tax=Rhinoderma darwinii TaxID=43563 RepID=UPI003F664B90
MEIKGLAFLPILAFHLCLGGILLCYTLTLDQDNGRLMIYISETGARYPQSVLFTTVLVGTAILGFALAFAQYKFMTLRAAACDMKQEWAQKILLGVALTSCIGIVLTGSFTMFEYEIIHKTGAVLAFGCGAVYNLVQSKYLYKLSFSRRYVCHVRMAVSVITAITAVICAASRIPVIGHLCEDIPCVEICNMVAIITEWLTLFFFLLTYLTYSDLQHLCLNMSWKSFTITIREKVQDSNV